MLVPTMEKSQILCKLVGSQELRLEHSLLQMLGPDLVYVGNKVNVTSQDEDEWVFFGFCRSEHSQTPTPPQNGERNVIKGNLNICFLQPVAVSLVSLPAGDVFHGLNKEDHRHPAPAAPRNSPTGLAPLPALSPAALSPASTPHLPNLAAPSFPKTATTAPGFVDTRKSFCPTPVAPPPSTTDGSISAPPSVCR